jgi:hypothetical protein
MISGPAQELQVAGHEQTAAPVAAAEEHAEAPESTLHQVHEGVERYHPYVDAVQQMTEHFNQEPEGPDLTYGPETEVTVPAEALRTDPPVGAGEAPELTYGPRTEVTVPAGEAPASLASRAAGGGVRALGGGVAVAGTVLGAEQLQSGLARNDGGAVVGGALNTYAGGVSTLASIAGMVPQLASIAPIMGDVIAPAVGIAAGAYQLGSTLNTGIGQIMGEAGLAREVQDRGANGGTHMQRDDRSISDHLADATRTETGDGVARWLSRNVLPTWMGGEGSVTDARGGQLYHDACDAPTALGDAARHGDVEALNDLRDAASGAITNQQAMARLRARETARAAAAPAAPTPSAPAPAAPTPAHE